VKRTRLAAIEQPEDDQPGKTDGATLRLCAVSRVERSIVGLIRFVVSPDGHITPDLACRLPGRGVWVTATRDAVTQAVNRNAFAKSLKRPVTIPEDLAGLIERLLATRARQSLSIANKAGLIATGFMKVTEALEGGNAVALIAASDGAPDGIGKLERKFRAIHSAKLEAGASLAPPDALIIKEFTGGELDLAFGRSNVIHGSLAPGAQSRTVLNDSLRLRRFRSNTVLEESASLTPTSDPAAASGFGSSDADIQADDIQSDTIQESAIQLGAIQSDAIQSDAIQSNESAAPVVASEQGSTDKA
jgi:uncharacterized protein